MKMFVCPICLLAVVFLIFFLLNVDFVRGLMRRKYCKIPSFLKSQYQISDFDCKK